MTAGGLGAAGIIDVPVYPSIHLSPPLPLDPPAPLRLLRSTAQRLDGPRARWPLDSLDRLTASMRKGNCNGVKPGSAPANRSKSSNCARRACSLRAHASASPSRRGSGPSPPSRGARKHRRGARKHRRGAKKHRRGARKHRRGDSKPRRGARAAGSSSDPRVERVRPCRSRLLLSVAIMKQMIAPGYCYQRQQ